MSHQDDLESNYKVASNEQPSNEIDRLIIQAAKDALENGASQNSETNDHDKSNVIKGRFKLKRWQTPVSIAAAALFTVSFISSYDFWQVNEQDFAQDSLESLSQQTDNKKEQHLRTQVILEHSKKVLQEKKLRNRIQMLSSGAPQANARSKPKVNLQDKILALDINQWLAKIETTLENNKVENAKAEIVILIKQHPLNSFTKLQRDRLDKINNKIHSAQTN
jgi:hypothetical protein